MRLDAALRWVECQSLNQLKIEDRTNHESPTIISVRIYANKESASVCISSKYFKFVLDFGNYTKTLFT